MAIVHGTMSFSRLTWWDSYQGGELSCHGSWPDGLDWREKCRQIEGIDPENPRAFIKHYQEETVAKLMTVEKLA
jgi:hypothetical protein